RSGEDIHGERLAALVPDTPDGAAAADHPHRAGRRCRRCLSQEGGNCHRHHRQELPQHLCDRLSRSCTPRLDPADQAETRPQGRISRCARAYQWASTYVQESASGAGLGQRTAFATSDKTRVSAVTATKIRMTCTTRGRSTAPTARVSEPSAAAGCGFGQSGEARRTPVVIFHGLLPPT